MELKFIASDKLSISSANMRHAKKPPDITDLLPSVRARGVIVPLIVRAAEGEAYEIVAGRRRFFAAEAVRAERESEGKASDPLPCAVMAADDDAAALEASLIENIARADAHEVELWDTFTRLVAKEGRSAEEIALTFGLTRAEVARILALGNLLPKVRDLYRTGEIDAASVRLLTMASKRQQKDWLALVADPDQYAPCGHNLKSWLFGGAAIPTSVALFDLADYAGEIVADLFGEEGYFGNADAFWAAQRDALAARAEAYRQAGWSDVVILEPGQYFNSWDYEKTPKRKGGKVYVTLTARGEATFHEGYVSRREARRAAAGEGAGAARPAKPEVTATLQSYIDLHRHAAVRARLIDYPKVALRLMVAHAIGGSHLVRFTPEPQRGGNDSVTESVEICPAETVFDRARRAALDLLGFDEDAPHVIGGSASDAPVAALFVRLLDLDDDAVLRILAIVIGEALAAGSVVVEALGQYLKVEMASAFAPDETFLDLIRDKEVLARMIAELAGEDVARANAKETARAQKAVIRDCLAGANGRAKVEAWVPRWLAFPPSAYTTRGGVGAVARFAQLGEIAAEIARAEAGPVVDAGDADDAAKAEAAAPTREAA